MEEERFVNWRGLKVRSVVGGIPRCVLCDGCIQYDGDEYSCTMCGRTPQLVYAPPAPTLERDTFPRHRRSRGSNHGPVPEDDVAALAVAEAMGAAPVPGDGMLVADISNVGEPGTYIEYAASMYQYPSVIEQVDAAPVLPPYKPKNNTASRHKGRKFAGIALPSVADLLGLGKR